MSAASVEVEGRHVEGENIEDIGLDFLWLELTNRCNLNCVHCYTESHPGSGDRDLLEREQYEAIMVEAYQLGCRNLQFIGGEPQLNRDLLGHIATARRIGFEFIEVFSNLTWLSNETLRCAVDQQVRFATSVYSDEPAIHDAITGVKGSHARTIRSLARLISNGVETRAAIIVIDQDNDAVGRAERFLRVLGVPHIRVSEVREFGRGEEVLQQTARRSGLCGHCWNGKLCIAPDGAAFPCVMARSWPVGNVLNEPLAQIVGGKQLQHEREAIYSTVWLPKITASGCTPECPQSCSPDLSTCMPLACEPATCPQSCAPPVWDCSPTTPR